MNADLLQSGKRLDIKHLHWTYHLYRLHNFFFFPYYCSHWVECIKCISSLKIKNNFLNLYTSENIRVVLCFLLFISHKLPPFRLEKNCSYKLHLITKKLKKKEEIIVTF